MTTPNVLAELVQLGPWAISVAVTAMVLRSPRMRPLLRCLDAAMWDLLLTARGVDGDARRRLLVDAARRAQELADGNTTPPTVPPPEAP